MNSVELEFEQRSMLDKEKYQEMLSSLLSLYPEVQGFTQINEYYDDDDFSFLKSGVVLRVRYNLNGKKILNLKISKQYGEALEMSENLSDEDHQNLLEKVIVPDGEIKETLLKRNLPLDIIHFITKLTTYRTEFKYKDGLIVLDQNDYGDIRDYNIEVEAPDSETAKKILAELADTYRFEITKNYLVKSLRAFLQTKKA